MMPGVFIINLERSAERWAQIKKHFDAASIPVTRVQAYDARADWHDVLTARGLNLSNGPDGVGINPYRGRMVALAEEACFASHMKALHDFVESEHTHALILEDDVYPLRDMATELSLLMKTRLRYDMIRLEGSRYKGARLAVALQDLPEAQLVASFAPCPGAGAYLVTVAGARKILSRAPHILMPVDDYLVNPGLTGCKTLNVAPWLFSQKGADSVISTVTGVKRYKVKRNLLGFVRQLVARLHLRFLLWRQAARYALRAGRLPQNFAWSNQGETVTLPATEKAGI